jgi:hypothetical protein
VPTVLQATSRKSREPAHPALHQEGCPAAGEGRWRVFEPVDRGSGRRKSWSGGNRGRLLQEASRQGHRRRTDEVSAHRAQGRARWGGRALRALVKIPAQAEFGRGTLWMSDHCDGPWPPDESTSAPPRLRRPDRSQAEPSTPAGEVVETRLVSPAEIHLTCGLDMALPG